MLCYLWSDPLLQRLPAGFQIQCTKRVWKGNLGIRDLTKIRCGNRENDKYFDGIRDLTAAREAGLAKIWAWDAGFFSPVCREFGKL